MDSPLRYDVELDAASHAEEGGELLARAFAACLLRSLERAATYLRFEYEDASVRVVAERHGTPPSFDHIAYELELETAESPGRIELLHRNLLRSGAVTSTLARTCRVEGRVRVREAAPA